LVDSFYPENETTTRHSSSEKPLIKSVTYQPDFDDSKYLIQRMLNDGSEHKIVKVRYTPSILEKYMLSCGFEGLVRSNQNFIFGEFIKSE